MDVILAKELERYRDVLEAGFGEALVAFGLQVQDRARPESDLDLLIVIRGLPSRRLDRHRLLSPFSHQVSDDFAATVSTVLLTPEEASTIKPFYLGLLDGHRILVDREGFVRAILARLQRRLASWGPGASSTSSATATGTSSPTMSSGRTSSCDVGMNCGSQIPHARVLRSMHLFAERVAPRLG